jgi:PTS system mannose-specific IIA component
MIGILVVGHGTFATGLVETLGLLVGPQTQIAAIEINPGDDMKQRRREMVRAIDAISDGDGIIILTDMFGGTPANLAISLMEKEKIEVITGANLPMAIKLASLRKTEPFDRATLGAQETGRKYINVVSSLLAKFRKRDLTVPIEGGAGAAPSSATRDRKSVTNGTQARRPRSKIGKAIIDNRSQVRITTAALSLLIDEKLESLRAQRPNSAHAKRNRDEQLVDYESLRNQLAEFRAAVELFVGGSGKEGVAVKSARTFAAGVALWWNKNHNLICERTFEMGLFLSAVGICSIVGVSGTTSVIVSGALAGGKPVVDALKSMAKLLTKTPADQDTSSSLP